MTEARSSDCEADTEDVDIEGNSQPVESLEEVSRMATQVSSTQGPMETAKGNEDHDEARAKINSEVPQREQQKTAPSKGAIDLEKLMNTIDMTRKVAMLQQRLTQASLLAQRSSSVALRQPARTTSPVSPPRTIQPPSALTPSNLRKRKSMASLSIVAPHASTSPGSESHPNTAILPVSPSGRPSTHQYSPGPRSPSYTVLRSPSSSAAAAGMHVLTSIASRRRQSGTGNESPGHNGNGNSEQAVAQGPRVAFAYPRSPGGSSALISVQTVRSPSRGRYISSTGFPRFETSGYSETEVGKRDGKEGVAEMDVDEDSAMQNPRKRVKGDVSSTGKERSQSSAHSRTQQGVLSGSEPDYQPLMLRSVTTAYPPQYRSTQPRKSSLTLMPAFSSNTIYGVHHHNTGSIVEPMYVSNSSRMAQKPRAASHSVESRPFNLRNTISGYKHVETLGAGASSPLRTSFASSARSISGARIDMPFGTDASDVDAANGLMSMLGSAPAAFNPSRIKSPPIYEQSSRPVEARMRVAKPRAASFASALTLNAEGSHPTHQITSPTRVRRLQTEKTRLAVSPSSLKRAPTKPSLTTPFSSDEEKQKASACASDEDQQAAEAILCLAASPSPAIAHSSPATKVRASGVMSADSRIGRVLFNDAADETDLVSSERSLRDPPSSFPLSVMSHKRQTLGESPLQQPPINNTSPTSDRFSRALPPPLSLPRKSTTQSAPLSDVAIPPLTASTVGDAEHPSISIVEPTELLSPPHSDHSKP